MLGKYDYLARSSYSAVFMNAFLEAQENSRLLGVYDKLYTTETSPLDVDVTNSILATVPPYVAYAGSAMDDVDDTDWGETLLKRYYQTFAVLPLAKVLGPSGEAAVENKLRSLAERTVQLKIDLINDLIVGGATAGTAKDGTAYFANAHTMGTGDNLNALALAAANFNTIYSAIVGFQDDRGTELLNPPTIALVSPALTAAAKTMFNPDRVFMYSEAGTATPTLLVGDVEVGALRTSPARRATGVAMSGTEWYLFNGEGAAGNKPFVIFDSGDPELHFLGPDSEYAKRMNQVLFIGKWFGVASYGPWWNAYKCNV